MSSNHLLSRLAILTMVILLGCPLARGQGPAPDSGSAAPPREGISLAPPVPVDTPVDLPSPPPPVPPSTDTPAAGVARPGGVPTLPGGGGGLAAAFSPVVGHVPVSFSYQGIEFFNSPVRGQDTHLGYFQQDFSILTPLWQDSRNEFSATARVGVESYDTQAILPDTGARFPSELWNVNLGVNYRHQFDNGWIGGGSVSVGSASDQPFHSIDEMTVSATGFARVPRGERDAWVFGVNMSSNSQVLPFVPIPFVAYLWNPSDAFQAVVGFPFATATYRPTDDLTLSVSYALLTTFHARASYRIASPVSVFCALDLDNENYYLADRTDSKQRFFYYSDRLSAGTQFILARHALLDVSGGYIFGRSYFEGTSSTSGDFNRVDVAPGAFLGAKLQLRF